MYFNSFPVIPYDSKGDLQFKDVTNLLRRVGMRTKLKTNTFLYDTYKSAQNIYMPNQKL